MKLHGTSTVNAQGILEIGGCSAVELIEKHGSPLWVMDEELIRNTCQRLSKAFLEKGNSQILYASKAFLTTAMCKIVNEEGLGLDVVSGGELYTALKAGFPMEKVFFHGNNKSLEEIELALKHEVGRIVVDNFYELHVLNGIASELNIKQAILLRITPGIEAHTHEYIKTGQIDSKFGFTLANGQAMEGVKTALKLPFLELKGIHCHIGSQIFEMGSYGHAAHVMIEFMKNIEKETGYVVEELNLGGGLGIYYSEGDEPASIDSYSVIVMTTVKDKCKEFSLPVPRILIEPGRSIAGPAGTTLYRVGSIKNIPGVRKYVAVDGGMNENLRPALYEAKYDVYAANKMNAPKTDKVTITGKCCESGDILAWNVNLPELEPGDILAMPTTGAYGYSMSGNYNRIPRQAVVLVYKGTSEEIVKRETYEDLIRNDIIPERLK
ncbi:diaminopimelate decarboxylase [Desulfitibacter alkalitolerans]|uniref:diaminopimelate decarboxylase n=1 Tax=Desulfitibacter alkalitolerans TaxID=264641 RepID=UPI00048507C3|nr:diaminopimelate decarboxylase [Desulfitibacter alkalitolerans]